MRLLLTGGPAIGKTTVVRNTLDKLIGIRCAGFYTEEIRQQGQRLGFAIFTIEGEEGTLASIDRGRTPAIGKYTVHIEEFEKLALPQIDPELNPADLYIIDEIGKMELLSQKFRAKVIDLLARPSNLLGTIAKRGKGFIEQIKGRNDIELVEVTRENRERLPDQIAQRILEEIQG